MTESAKEYKYGTKWVNAIDIIIVIVFGLILAPFALSDELSALILASVFFTFPRFLRAVICSRWPSATANILASDNLSRSGPSKFGVSWVSEYKTNIEYDVNGHKYTSIIFSDEALTSTKEIYYKPSDPSIFTRKKGLDWVGKWFIASVIVLICTLIYRIILGFLN